MPLLSNQFDSMEELKIKFNGQRHQIEANTLINSLIHFTTIVQEVNRELATGRKIEININALPEGSFLVHFTLQTFIDKISNLFSAQNVAVAKQVIDCVTGIYNFSKFLKGKSPKSVKADNGTVSVQNTEGEVTVLYQPVFNIYHNNRTVHEAITQEFKALQEDEHVTGYDMLDKNNNPLVQIPREEFANIANLEEETLLPNEQSIRKRGMLKIYTLSFDIKNKWTFVYEGHKFNSRISDDFAQRIDKGESFAKGDSLDAEFEIKQQFDQGVNAYVNKAFKIIRIINHIPRSQQPDLGLPN